MEPLTELKAEPEVFLDRWEIEWGYSPKWKCPTLKITTVGKDKPLTYTAGTQAQLDELLRKFKEGKYKDLQEDIQRQERLARAREQGHTIQVGDLYYDSWGYEQTNIDFYQVVELRGKTKVVLRRIHSEVVHYSDNSYSGRKKPLRDQFSTQYPDPVEKVATLKCYGDGEPAWHLSSRHGGCLIRTTDTEEHYYSNGY
jgi:hypothetical protein